MKKDELDDGLMGENHGHENRRGPNFNVDPPATSCWAKHPRRNAPSQDAALAINAVVSAVGKW
jgi:hypothetical protein